MINFDFDKLCYGCKACESICTHGAISFESNLEGFLAPKIDESRCVSCGLCEKVCPYLNENANNQINDEDKIYALFRRDSCEYKEYTSSGIFHYLARTIIMSNGYVCGCVWDKNMKAVHIVSNNLDDVKRMSYSKYVQSDISDCFLKIKEKLNNGKKVLFCGTPCQAAALRMFLMRDFENLYVLAIVCHGVPSPGVWNEYKNLLQEQVKSEMINANFRYKGKYGWITPYTKYEFKSGKVLEKLSFTEDPYVIAFGADILHRNSCYRCKYKGSNNNADLVIGDFWGCPTKLLKASKNRGISAVIVHTQKGNELIDEFQKQFYVEKSTIDNITSENRPIMNPVKYNPYRETFYDDFSQSHSVMLLYTMMNRKKYRVKRILYKFSVFEMIKRFKYLIKH